MNINQAKKINQYDNIQTKNYINFLCWTSEEKQQQQLYYNERRLKQNQKEQTR